MNDSSCVCFFECTCNLNCDVEGFTNFKLRSTNFPSQRNAVYVLGRDVMPAFVVTNLMNCQNVWMIQCRSRARFLFKTMKSISIGGVFLAQDLDSDFASELHIFGKIDLTHTTGAEFFDDSIMRDLVHALRP